jgi:hypothetical protein
MYVTRFTMDQQRSAEFIACLWQGPVPGDLVLHEWLYLQGEPRAILLIWEGDRPAEEYVQRAFGSFGTLETEEVSNATPGLSTCLQRDLEGFGAFLRDFQGASDEAVAAQLDLRRRGLEAATLEEAAAAGRAWQAERS